MKEETVSHIEPMGMAAAAHRRAHRFVNERWMTSPSTVMANLFHNPFCIFFPFAGEPTNVWVQNNRSFPMANVKMKRMKLVLWRMKCDMHLVACIFIILHSKHAQNRFRLCWIFIFICEIRGILNKLCIFSKVFACAQGFLWGALSACEIWVVKKELTIYIQRKHIF